jgi:hypothetical protein
MMKALEDLTKKVEALGGAAGIGQLAKAYTAAWAEMDHAVKNAENPHFKSDYATLDAVLDAIRPVFARHDLSLLQAPGQMSADGKRISITNILMHGSGQHLQFATELPIGDRLTPQAVGSAITYGRRYAVAAVGGIAQVDDDGNAASAPVALKKEPKSEQGDSYAEKVAALIEAFAKAETVEGLEVHKESVRNLGDKVVAEAYLARKEAIKKGAKQ